MKNNTAKNIKRISLLFLLVLTACILVSCFTGGSETVYSKDALTENIINETDLQGNSVADYIDRWNFPLFSSSRLSEVENVFEDHYYKELPSAYDAASLTAARFIDKYYDKTNLNDKDAVTDALITCYVSVVGDKYSIFRTPVEYDDYSNNMSGSFIGIGVTVIESDSKLIEVIETLPDSSARAAGILPGDLICKIDGKTVAELGGYTTAVDAILGEEGSFVLIGIMRGEEELSFNVERKRIASKSVTYTLGEDGIGYIRIDSFKSNTDDQFREAIDYMEENGALGVIYDLRNNGGGYLSTVENMLSYIAPKGTTLVSFSHGYDDPYVAKNSHTYFAPTVVLCNYNTASAAELFTAGMRDLADMGYFEASIVGTTTRGKGIMQNTYHLSGGSTLTLTVAYYNPPSGKNYHEVGIEPNVKVEATEGTDSQLLAAYEQIKAMTVKKAA